MAYTVSDDGTYMPLRAELSWSQQQQWQLAEETARRERRPPVTGALGALHEEIAALCMSAASLEAAAGGVYEVAIQLAAAIGDQEAIRALDEARRLSVAHLWRLANGEVDER